MLVQGLPAGPREHRANQYMLYSERCWALNAKPHITILLTFEHRNIYPLPFLKDIRKWFCAFFVQSIKVSNIQP